MREAFDYYTEGFIISTVIAFFKNEIPAMKNTLKTISLVVDGAVADQNRFGGLVSDPNFFTAVVSGGFAIIFVFLSPQIAKLKTAKA